MSEIMTEAGLAEIEARYSEAVHALVAEVRRLRAAIVEHRSQKADDRCVEDDDRLYAALGDGVPCDRRVGDKAAMLANCARFIERRCASGGWPTYAELERQRDEARALAVPTPLPRSATASGWHDDLEWLRYARQALRDQWGATGVHAVKLAALVDAEIARRESHR